MSEPFVGQVRAHPHDTHLFEVWIGQEWLTLAPNPNPGYVAPAYEVEALYDRLESAEAERDRLRAEPVLAPNALDASAERWQLYAAKLEVTLGELRGERDRLRALYQRWYQLADSQGDSEGRLRGCADDLKAVLELIELPELARGQDPRPRGH